MAFTIAELAPVAQYSTIGYAPPTGQTPAVFGSVADDSDATYTTLASEYQEGGAQFSDVLTLDFVLPTPSVVPVFYYMKMRARDNADFASHPGRFVSFIFDYSAVADPPGSTFDSWSISSSSAVDGQQFGALANGSVTSPNWFAFSYVGGTPVDTVNPSADTWFPIDNGESTGYVAHQTYAALAGSGLRFTFYPQATYNLDPRTSFLDVYEVRMVVAYEEAAPAAAYITAMRQVQRGDGYGIGGVPRAVTGRTRQASLRSGPGAIL